MNAVSVVVAPYSETTNVVQVIHAKHLLFRVLDGIENWRWGTIDCLTTVQPLSTSIGEAESCKVPESGSLVVFVVGVCFKPTRSLCI